MPIDFPAPPLPLQGPAEQLQAEAHEGAVSVDIGGYNLHVHAPGVLSEEQILAVTHGITDLSTAVRALAVAAQRQGVLAPKTLYVKVDQDVYVSVYAGTITAVQAPEELAPYFKGVTEAGASINDFERERVLASVHANRAGYDLMPSFEPVGDSSYQLDLVPGTQLVNPGSVRVNLSNVGNRFVGREFLDLEARRGDHWGDEFQVLARTASSILNVDEKEPGSDYHENQLGWSRVTPYGIFGINGQYLDYRQQASGIALNGELWKVDANWTGIVHASPTDRLSVQGRLDYTHKNLKLNNDGQLIQKEPYPSIELGTAYSSTFGLFGQGFLGTAGLSARKGFGNADPQYTVANLSYWLVRPSYVLRTQSEPFAVELQLTGQYSSETVPEQQQWILGGVGNLHAYVPGVGLGDRGGLARLVGEYSGYEYLGVRLKPKVFIEYGLADYRHATAGRQAGVQSVADIGAEVVAQVGRYFEAAVAAAAPVVDDNISQSNRDLTRTDFFFRLTGKF
jgi:Haemolysin secretion/activation protein ShlB/FhaC/HecB